MINIDNYQLIKRVNVKGVALCLYKLKEITLLTGDDDGNIIQYQLNNDKLEEVSRINNAHKGTIYCLYSLNNYSIILSAGGDDNKFKIWK